MQAQRDLSDLSAADLAACKAAMYEVGLDVRCPTRLPQNRSDPLCGPHDPCTIHNDLGDFVLVSAVFQLDRDYVGLEGSHSGVGHFELFARHDRPNPPPPCGGAIDRGDAPHGLHLWACPLDLVSNDEVTAFHLGAIKPTAGHTVLAGSINNAYVEVSLHGDTAFNQALAEAIASEMLSA